LALCLSLGHVTARDCADFVNVSESSGVSGQYNKSGGNPPVYSTGLLGGFVIRAKDGKVGFRSSGTEHPEFIYYLEPTPSDLTCFPDNLNAIYELKNARDNTSAGTVLLQGPHPECAENVYLSAAGSGEAANDISGSYMRTSPDTTPWYTKLRMYDMDYQDNGYINITGDSNVYFDAPSYKTCFPQGLDQTFNVSGPSADEVGSVTLSTDSVEGDIGLPNQCPECKHVLDGPLQNFYELVGENDPRCNDGCLYRNPEGRVFCFESGQYQVLLECTPGWPIPHTTTHTKLK